MNNIKKIILGVIMASFMSVVSGCTLAIQTAANDIELNLKNKYGTDFTVYALGDRLDRETSTAYVYPNEDDSLRFFVNAKGNGDIVYDDYSYRMVCRKVENLVNEKFYEEKLKTECFADFIDCSSNTEKDISVEEFVKRNNSHCLKIVIVIAENPDICGSLLCKVYENICKDLPLITVKFSLFILSEDNARVVLPNARNEVTIFGADRIKKMGADKPFVNLLVDMKDGMLSKSAEEIDSIIKEENK